MIENEVCSTSLESSCTVPSLKQHTKKQFYAQPNGEWHAPGLATAMPSYNIPLSHPSPRLNQQ